MASTVIAMTSSISVNPRTSARGTRTLRSTSMDSPLVHSKKARARRSMRSKIDPYPAQEIDRRPSRSERKIAFDFRAVPRPSRARRKKFRATAWTSAHEDRARPRELAVFLQHAHVDPFAGREGVELAGERQVALAGSADADRDVRAADHVDALDRRGPEHAGEPGRRLRGLRGAHHGAHRAAGEREAQEDPRAAGRVHAPGAQRVVERGGAALLADDRREAGARIVPAEPREARVSVVR